MEWARFNSLNHLVRATELTVHICSLQAHMLSSPSYAIKECGVMMPHLACLSAQKRTQRTYGLTVDQHRLGVDHKILVMWQNQLNLKPQA